MPYRPSKFIKKQTLQVKNKLIYAPKFTCRIYFWLFAPFRLIVNFKYRQKSINQTNRLP
ncbi:hypothetical protein CAMSH0001_0675 [Campylobacter showae RM3277]|uniref:Uncharacterized protein n=1 Tax=Campylobacter showae RM3277 TaxID=553219 RepID=C6RGL9_9BACT|nr:hypothetical protein CAMSH0001_0675 [Campylobacter showae RM3277]